MQQKVHYTIKIFKLSIDCDCVPLLNIILLYSSIA